MGADFLALRRILCPHSPDQLRRRFTIIRIADRRNLLQARLSTTWGLRAIRELNDDKQRE
jgi:hypothetical protein